VTASERLVATLQETLATSSPDDMRFVDELIADNLAIALAASQTSLAVDVLASALAGTSGGACSVIGGDITAPPAQAAFANAALAHILDFDDIYDAGRLHPTTVVLPAALAAGELVGANGDAFHDGVLLGGEAMCRFGMSIEPTATGPASHWFVTQLVGYVGAAIAAATAMGLDEDGILSAIGLSVMQAAGTKQPAATPGSTARAIYPAFAAAGGLTAALLARGGMVGAADALDGSDGLLPLYLGVHELPEVFYARRGWRYAETSIKPWPCCRISHPYVSAAFAVRQLIGEGFDLAGIEEVRLDVNASAAKLCVPLEARIRPATLQDAKYSIPFMTAHALVHGCVDLDSTKEQCLADEVVLAVAALTSLRDGLPDGPGHPPARVTVKHHAMSYSAEAVASQLDGNGPGAGGKLIECFAFAGFPDAEQCADALQRAVRDLPTTSTDALVRILAESARSE